MYVFLFLISDKLVYFLCIPSDVSKGESLAGLVNYYRPYFSGSSLLWPNGQPTNWQPSDQIFTTNPIRNNSLFKEIFRGHLWVGLTPFEGGGERQVLWWACVVNIHTMNVNKETILGQCLLSPGLSGSSYSGPHGPTNGDTWKNDNIT